MTSLMMTERKPEVFMMPMKSRIPAISTSTGFKPPIRSDLMETPCAAVSGMPPTRAARVAPNMAVMNRGVLPMIIKINVAAMMS